MSGTWKDNALCVNAPIEWFFEDYDKNAKEVDELCSVCPVRIQCLKEAIFNKDIGCHGGIYFNSGKPDKYKNSHKTEEEWTQLRVNIANS